MNSILTIRFCVGQSQCMFVWRACVYGDMRICDGVDELLNAGAFWIHEKWLLECNLLR